MAFRFSYLISLWLCGFQIPQLNFSIEHLSFTSTHGKVFETEFINCWHTILNSILNIQLAFQNEQAYCVFARWAATSSSTTVTDKHKIMYNMQTIKFIVRQESINQSITATFVYSVFSLSINPFVGPLMPSTFLWMHTHDFLCTQSICGSRIIQTPRYNT